MNRKSMSLAGLLASGILVSALQAQPPEPGERGPDRRGPRPGGPTFMMMNPLAAAIDADKNNEISAEELKNAANALETLDKNDDGKLTFDELRPSFSRDSDRPGFGPRRDRGPDADVADRPRGERRFEFRGRERDGRERGLRPERPDGFRPTPEAFVKRAMTFDADQDGKLSREELAKFAEQIVNRSRDARPGDRPGPRGNRDGDRQRPDRGDAEDGDRADRPRPDGRERGLRPERPDGFRPTPEAFVKRAMTFDADQDGKLSREELAKFAEQIVNRSRDARPGDRPGPRGNRDGDRPDRDRPDRERPDRGERETRPEAE